MSRQGENGRWTWRELALPAQVTAAVLAAAAMAALGGACTAGELGSEEDTEPVGVATDAIQCITIQRTTAATTIVEDAVIASSPLDPSKAITVYGAVPQMVSGHIGPEIRRVVMKVNMAAVPTGAVVTSADLTFWMIDSPGNAPVDLYAGTKLWSESTVTWNQLVGAPGSGLGALIASVPTAGTPNRGIKVPLPVTLVRGWVVPKSNVGLVFEHPLAGRTEIASSESSGVVPRPKLSVCYCVPAPETCDGIDNDCDGQIDEMASCDDKNPCTDDACSAGACVHTATSCDDGDPCTQDTCVGDLGCQSTFVPGSLCTLCPSGDAGAPSSCDDGNDCTDDSCDPMTGCSSTPGLDGALCGAASTGVCKSGQCMYPQGCGDGFCDENQGEDCETCYSDCASSPHCY